MGERWGSLVNRESTQSELLTWLVVRPLHAVSVVRVLQLVGGQLEAEDLLVDLGVGPRAVHLHLGVLRLRTQPLAGQPRGVGAAGPAVPAVCLHGIFARPNLGILTHDLRKTGPEALGVLHLGDDVTDEGVEAGTAHVAHAQARPVHGGAQQMLVAEPSDLSLAESGLAAVLKHLGQNRKC